jgi:hypothetical protein
MAHISVTLGYFRLLQHLFTWEIDINAVDSMGSTALHYAYLFRQEDCARFLVHSGANQFILDALGRSPSDVDPYLEVMLQSTMDVDSDNSADRASPIQCDIKMPEGAEKLYAQQYLIQQWGQQVEDKRREEVPPPGIRTLGPPKPATTPPTIGFTAHLASGSSSDMENPGTQPVWSSSGPQSRDGPPLAYMEEREKGLVVSPQPGTFGDHENTMGRLASRRQSLPTAMPSPICGDLSATDEGSPIPLEHRPSSIHFPNVPSAALNVAKSCQSEIKEIEEAFNGSTWLRNDSMEPLIGDPLCPRAAEEHGIPGMSCYTALVKHDDNGLFHLGQ